MRCLIVDDSTDFVEAARHLLEHGGITVVGVASTSAEIDFMPTDLSRSWTHLGAGPFLTPRIRRPAKIGQAFLF